jgi:hypothetical protein
MSSEFTVTDDRAAFVAHLAMEVIKMRKRNLTISIEDVVIQEINVLQSLRQIPACFKTVLEEVNRSNHSQKLIIEEVSEVMSRAEHESE